MKNNVEIKKYPNISVVISIWNSAKTIEAVVRSCLNQTLPPIEILICDDGSTDESRKIIEQLDDKRVSWVPSQHTGTPAVPRNNGIKMSKGDWIAICDSDDEWLPTKLEKQIALAMKLNYKAVCTNALIKINNEITSRKVSNWKKENISFKNLIKSNDIVCSSVMVHSSVFHEVGGFTEIVEYGAFADYICWLRVATKTNFAFVNEPLVIYDDHPETSLRSLFKDGKLLKEKAFNDFINWAKKRKLYLFILQIKKYLIIEWVKKVLRDKIKLCYKK